MALTTSGLKKRVKKRLPVGGKPGVGKIKSAPNIGGVTKTRPTGGKTIGGLSKTKPKGGGGSVGGGGYTGGTKAKPGGGGTKARPVRGKPIPGRKQAPGVTKPNRAAQVAKKKKVFAAKRANKLANQKKLAARKRGLARKRKMA